MVYRGDYLTYERAKIAIAAMSNAEEYSLSEFFPAFSDFHLQMEWSQVSHAYYQKHQVIFVTDDILECSIGVMFPLHQSLEVWNNGSLVHYQSCRGLLKRFDKYIPECSINLSLCCSVDS